jgi:hypothetical protein
MTPDTVLRRKRGLEHIDIEGEVLLYDGLHLRLLPGVAAEVWRRVDGTTTADTIAADIAMATSPPADRAQVQGDVLAYLEELLEHTVLELAPTDQPTYAKPRHIGYVQDDGQTLLIDLGNARRRALTPTGGRVWELTCELGAEKQVVAALRGDYPDAPDSLPDDVADLLTQLCEEGYLIRRS